MGMILYIVPNLQEDEPQAAVACNCMFNVGAWAGDEEFIHTYVTQMHWRSLPFPLSTFLL